MKTNPTPDRLAGFRDWLLETGRGELTAAGYVAAVRRSAGHAKGVAGRLTSKLAPNTLHAERAALRSYATYTDDGDLLVQCKKIRLPPARRVSPKVELAYEVWRQMVKAIQADDRATPIVKACLLIMALRGLRVGDVLRLRKREVGEALKTGRLVFEAKGRRRLDYAIASIRPMLETVHQTDAYWTTLAELVSRNSRAANAQQATARRQLFRELKRIAKTIAVDDVYNHRLRRTYATHYVRQLKGDPQAIMKLQSHMGWASATTAMQYVDAVNVDELDRLGETLVDELLEDPKPTKPPAKRRRR